MKNFVSIFVLMLLVSINVKAQFAFLYSSAGMEYGKANAIDIDNNYINSALFQNTINVNPSGTTTLTAPGMTTQIALTKYNSQGELLWAKHFGGTTTSEAPHGIECDNAKNIYVTGYFGSTTTTGALSADFNPNGGGTITTQGNEDCFVAKYDQNGNYIWAFGLGNIGQETQERAWDISVDGDGNSYIVGGFHGTMNFNPLGTVMNYTLPNSQVGLFVAKYNTNGICQWVVMLDAQCTDVFTEGYATCDLDNSGNLFVAGNFRATNVNFNPLGTASTLSSSGITDIFIAKYDVSNGNLNWVKKIGGAGSEVVSPGALRCDNNGNPYFTGRLSGTGSVDFDPSNVILNVSNSALFLASYDTNGNLRNAIGMNSGAGDGGHRVSFDNNNNVFIAGWMNGTATFGNITLTAISPTADVFFAKYNNELTTCHFAFNFGGAGSSANNICAGLIVDKQNNFYITGQLYGTNADFDPSPTNQLLLSSIGQNDCFVAKYDNSGNLWKNSTTSINNQFENNLSINIFPNPTKNIIFVNGLKENTKISIYDLNGKLVFNKQITNKQIDISSFQNGIYAIKIETEKGIITRKFVKQ